MTCAGVVASWAPNSPHSDLRGAGGNSTEAALARIATVIWIIIGIAFAGVFGLVVLATPALTNEAAELLPWAALAGFIVAIPASIFIARRILAESGNR
jgi:nitrate reductase NapE component